MSFCQNSRNLLKHETQPSFYNLQNKKALYNKKFESKHQQRNIRYESQWMYHLYHYCLSVVYSFSYHSIWKRFHSPFSTKSWSWRRRIMQNLGSSLFSSSFCMVSFTNFRSDEYSWFVTIYTNNKINIYYDP